MLCADKGIGAMSKALLKITIGKDDTEYSIEIPNVGRIVCTASKKQA